MTKIMNLEDIEIEFLIFANAKNLIRDADIGIDVINGEKNKILAKKYSLSTTSIIFNYKKLCRRLDRSLWDNEEISPEQKEHLRNIEFKSADGIIIINKLKEYVLKRTKENPHLRWIDQPIKDNKLKDVLLIKINKLIERAEKKKIYQIKMAEKEFMVTKRQLTDILDQVIIIDNEVIE